MSPASLFVVALGAVLSLPIVARVRQRRFDPFEPVVLFVAAYGVVFVVRPASMLVNGDLSYMDIDVRGTFPRAVLLALAGGVAFVCAYELSAGCAIGRRLASPSAISLRSGTIGAFVLVAVAAVGLYVMLSPAGGLRGFRLLFRGRSPELDDLTQRGGAYLLYASMLVVPAALILFSLAIRQRTTWRICVSALAFVLVLALTIPLGSRIFLLPLAGGAFTLLYLRRGARPRPALLLVLALLAVFASYALLVVREPSRRSHSGAELQALAEHPARAFYPVLHGHDAEMAPVLAAALHVVPSRLHHRYGAVVLGDLVLRPIPRPLWAGKPEPIEAQLVEALWPNLPGAHPSFTPLLFFYWDFGVPGVVVGMALFGLICRVLWEWFRRHDEALSAQLIFAMGLWMIVPGVRDDPVDTIVLASFMMLPLILVAEVPSAPWATIRPLLARARLSQR